MPARWELFCNNETWYPWNFVDFKIVERLKRCLFWNSWTLRPALGYSRTICEDFYTVSFVTLCDPWDCDVGRKRGSSIASNSLSSWLLARMPTVQNYVHCSAYWLQHAPCIHPDWIDKLNLTYGDMTRTLDISSFPVELFTFIVNLSTYSLTMLFKILYSLVRVSHLRFITASMKILKRYTFNIDTILSNIPAESLHGWGTSFGFLDLIW